MVLAELLLHWVCPCPCPCLLHLLLLLLLLRGWTRLWSCSILIFAPFLLSLDVYSQCRYMTTTDRCRADQVYLNCYYLYIHGVASMSFCILSTLGFSWLPTTWMSRTRGQNCYNIDKNCRKGYLFKLYIPYIKIYKFCFHYII